MKYLMLFIVLIGFDISAQNKLGFAAGQITEKAEINELSTQKTQLKDTLFLVEKFYMSGKLYSQTEIIYQSIVDTSYTEDLDTGEMQMVIQHFSKEVYHGKHCSFADDDDFKIIAKGRYNRGVKSGFWISELMGFREQFYYDNKGRLSSYSSFFQDNTIKMEGYYCSVPSYITDCKINHKRNSRNEVYYPQPCGVWCLYDECGNLIQEIVYEHVNWK